MTKTYNEVKPCNIFSRFFYHANNFLSIHLNGKIFVEKKIKKIINIPGYGDKLGVEQWLLLRSHWSSKRNSSSAVGPPFGIGSSER